MGKNEYGRVAIWVDGWWTDKNERAKISCSKTIDIVSYALKVSIDGVICVFVAHFRQSGTFESL